MLARRGMNSGMHFRKTRVEVRGVVALLAFALVVATAACRKSESTASAPAAASPASSTAPTTPAANAPAAKSAEKPVPDAVKKLLGRWLRTDGGYVLELKGADVSGVVQAAYYNPKPINVSRAIWMQGAQGLQVMVELNDVGYPGATYVLSHDAQTDRLVGQYNQPAMQQSFDIEFLRQQNPLSPMK